MRWWSALALLRSLASSPPAAAQTLRHRAAPADTITPEEADEVGRRAVLDQVEDEIAEAADVPPGGDPDEPGESAFRRHLHKLARRADGLTGAKDRKLVTAVQMVKELVDEGFKPIVFCRFIPTAECVATHLRQALGTKISVAAVTGTLPPHERELRVAALAASEGPRVLVATDCLSEGINLQHSFDAVIHYDLSWNPTRHEQREGRVDRFGQPASDVRTVTFWGTDNHIDEIVLDVLLRKHTQIRERLGISVPVPGDSNQVVEAIMEGVLLGGPEPQQLQFDEIVAAQQQTLFAEWEDAAEREHASRAMYAQRAIDVDEVAREVAAVRDAIGSKESVERFLRATAASYLATVADQPDGTVTFDFTEAPREIRHLVQLVVKRLRFTARFDPPVDDHQVLLTRTHPLVERLASNVLDTALDPHAHAIAARAGAIRTRAMTRRTTLLLVRFRFHLLAIQRDEERPLLAEDARILAFTGDADRAEWLPAHEAEALVDASPDANIAPEHAARFVAKVTAGFEHLEPQLAQHANELAERLVDQHRRVRDAARRRGVRYQVRPHLPPDVLGVYLLLPAEVV